MSGAVINTIWNEDMEAALLRFTSPYLSLTYAVDVRSIRKGSDAYRSPLPLSRRTPLAS